MSMKMAICPKTVQKNVHLGINGNLCDKISSDISDILINIQIAMTW